MRYFLVTTLALAGLALFSAADEVRTRIEKPGILNPATGEVRVDVDGAVDGNLSEIGAKEIVKPEEFNASLAKSADGPVLLFKHSTQCSISGAAYRRVADYVQKKGEAAPPIYLVKVIESRPVSQAIEKTLGVKHKSPQIILLRDEKAIWHTSHEKVTQAAIDTAVVRASAAGACCQTAGKSDTPACCASPSREDVAKE